MCQSNVDFLYNQLRHIINPITTTRANCKKDGPVFPPSLTLARLVFLSVIQPLCPLRPCVRERDPSCRCRPAPCALQDVERRMLGPS